MPTDICMMLFLIVFISTICSAVLGMGGGLLMMGGLSLWLPIPQAMMIHGLLQFISNGFRASLSLKEIHYRGAAFYVLGALISLGVWCFLQLTLSKSWILIILGLLAFIPLLPLGRFRPDFLHTSHQVLCGMLVTGIQLTAGAAGPVLDIFFTHTNMTKNQIIATKSLTQTFGHLTKVLYFGFLGSALKDSDFIDWHLSLLIFAAFMGTLAGRKIGFYVSESLFRSLTRKIILMIGIVYVFQGFWLLSV